jgi:hypothetical protein
MICVLRKTAKNRDRKNQRAVQRERYRSGTGHRSGTVRAVHGSGTASGTVQRYRTVQDRTVQDGRYRDGTRTVRRYYDGTGHPHFQRRHPTVQHPTVQHPTVQDDGTGHPHFQSTRHPHFQRPPDGTEPDGTEPDGTGHPHFQRRYREPDGTGSPTVQDTHISRYSSDGTDDGTGRTTVQDTHISTTVQDNDGTVQEDGTGHPHFQRRHPTVQHPTVQGRYRTPTFPATTPDGTAPDGTGHPTVQDDGTGGTAGGTGHPHFPVPVQDTHISSDGTERRYSTRRYRRYSDGTGRYRTPTFPATTRRYRTPTFPATVQDTRRYTTYHNVQDTHISTPTFRRTHISAHISAGRRVGVLFLFFLFLLFLFLGVLFLFFSCFLSCFSFSCFFLFLFLFFSFSCFSFLVFLALWDFISKYSIIKTTCYRLQH